MSESHCVSCGSCGFPMQAPADFAGGMADSAYCSTCGDEFGRLRPYDDVLQANAAYYEREQGLHPAAARELARALLASMPAWKSADPTRPLQS
ncbi:MAG TPA: zinc ribbon domain-containing protein [Pseudomonadales bacterium]|nr:zinc ribbon domain-containing protein [Pseudomonadales bacterium]